MKSFTEINALDGDDEFLAYTSQPVAQATAAIIVLQEAFGVNAGIKTMCDTWADRGYLAIAPDLFWRIRPEIELNPDIPEELQEGIDLLGVFDQDLAVRDIEATIRAARAMIGGGKVGAVGYCIGGRLAVMTAARTDINASVGYYGVAIPYLLNEAHAIAHELMLHIPTADGFVLPAEQKAIHDVLDSHPKVTLYDYEGLDHGFATAMGKRRDEAAATLADGRTAAFFAKHLG